MTSKNSRVAEALKAALELSENLEDESSFALETLRASVQGIITFISLDCADEALRAASLQKLCATIRSDSKYADQAQLLPADAQIFAISIRSDMGGYCVIGGPGGQYRLTDVHIYATHKDQLVRLT